MKLCLTTKTGVKTIEAEPGKLIYELIREPAAGQMHTPCGGKGTCGKCRVIVSGEVSSPDESERKYLSEDDLGKGIRLACHCRAAGDVMVEIPDSSQMEIQTSGLGYAGGVADTVKVYRITLAKPTLSEPIPTDQNLRQALGNPNMRIPPALLNKAASAKHPHLWAVTAGNSLIDLTAGEETPRPYVFAVDIGTSTVAAYLCDPQTGAITDVAACENPQRSFGADVISRINYIMETRPDALESLAKVIRTAINSLLGKLCARNGIAAEQVCCAVVTGNTVMQHIYAGLDPSGIANAPFIAASLFDSETSPVSVGLDINPAGAVYLPLCFASYVGGDIATGIIASDTDRTSETRLFLDVGTNGEIALRRDGKLYLCATAAGPAFEGAHIKKGVPGIDGAINRVWHENGALRCETIGGVLPPVGICGSGIIDAVAAMLDAGMIDETGYLESDDELDGESVCYLDRDADIYITQKDIREIQLAKSAISAGMLTLLEHTSTLIGQVGSLILAGGFGAHMNPVSACRIGLIPAELEGRIMVGGNTAGMGAVACAMQTSARERISSLAGASEYLELSGNATFMDLYVEHMMF